MTTFRRAFLCMVVIAFVTTSVAKPLEKIVGQDASIVQGLSGSWSNAQDTERFAVGVNGNTIEIFLTQIYASEFGWNSFPENAMRWDGTVENLTIRGMYTVDRTKPWVNGSFFKRPFTGTISPDGSRIHLEYTDVGPKGANGSYALGWADTEMTKDLVRRKR